MVGIFFREKKLLVVAICDHKRDGCEWHKKVVEGKYEHPYIDNGTADFKEIYGE